MITINLKRGILNVIPCVAFLCFSLVPLSTEAVAQTTLKVVHVAPPTPERKPYLYVPFDVPPGATKISVSYAYDHMREQNALDIGIIDSGSVDPEKSLKGFRGWSGGRRSEFFISQASATPGYLPGNLPAGKWHVLLGLYRVGPEGVDVSFKISIDTGTQLKSTTISSSANRHHEFQRLSHFVKRYEWISGDLHMHTVHSDGDWTVSEIITAARKAGLSFVCITDHNTVSHHREIDASNDPSFIVMRGEEVTTYGGHANAWNLPSGTMIDFRVRPKDSEGISAVALQTHRADGLISINHPFALCPGCSWSYDQRAIGFDAIEVWNGPWDQTDEKALAWWDKLLQEGRRITAIASSDSHRPTTPIGSPATRVALNKLTKSSVIESVRSGRAYLTKSALDPELQFEGSATRTSATSIPGQQITLSKPGKIRFHVRTNTNVAGNTIVLVSNGQKLREFQTNGNQEWSFEIQCNDASYFRLEVRDQAGAMVALTNPIYVRVKRSRHAG